MFFTPYDLLIIPPLLLAMFAQAKVRSAYAKYSQIGTRSGLTGAEVAYRVLTDADVGIAGDGRMVAPGAIAGIEPVPGNLTDHYNPRTRMLGLSEGVFNGRSIAALGIAAHEVGHAIQHARGFAPLALRTMIYPVCNIGSTLAWPLFFIGIIARFPMLIQAAIIFYTLAVVFTVITLPVEFDASRRALKALGSGGYLDAEELQGARSVLRAAALTYVAATAMAAAQLLRMVLIGRGRD